MLELVCPKLAVDGVAAVTPALLAALGIRGVIVDLDNTTVPWGAADFPPATECWVRELQAAGLRICFLSNNGYARVGKMVARFQAPFVHDACKPLRSGFRRAAAQLGLEPAEIAVVGDQLFTDVLGGNLLGAYTIWVQPLSRREFPGTKINRMLERLALRRLKARGMLPAGPPKT